MWIIIVIILILLALIIYTIIESTGFTTVTYEILTSKPLKKDLKIAFMADLHNKDYGNNNDVLIEAVNSYSPDMVCLAGDMVTSGWDIKFDYSGTLDFIRKLSELYPVYYSLGNHEERFERERDKFPHQFEEISSAMGKYGVNFLNNQSISLCDNSVKIYGLTLPHQYFRRFKRNILEKDTVEKCVGCADRNVFSILLAHDPSHFANYADWGADIVLSGHIHGGIVSLPFIGGAVAPGIRLFPKYDAGHYHEKDSDMILTRGIGSHLVPIRIRNKAEIVFINIKGEQNESQC